MPQHVHTCFLLLVLAATHTQAATPEQLRLYVTNSAGDDVTVVDLATNKAIGHIVVGPHPHGIATPASQDFLLVTVEGRNPGELVWIDPRTDTVTRRMDIGPAPNQLAITPDGKTACVPCSDGYYELIDVERAKILTRIYTGGRPHNTLCSPDGKHFYLAPMGAPKRVSIVDVATQRIEGSIRFTDVVRPIALSADEKHLFAEVDGLVGFEMADVGARKMIQRIPARLSPEQSRVASRSHGLGIRPDQRELWECDVEHHEVHVYDLTADRPQQLATIPIGSQVYWLTFSPDGKLCYVSARGADAVAVVDTGTKQVTARIAVGKQPKRLLVIGKPGK